MGPAQGRAETGKGPCLDGWRKHQVAAEWQVDDRTSQRASEPMLLAGVLGLSEPHPEQGRIHIHGEDGDESSNGQKC